MYMHVPILLLTEIPQPGKQGKRSPGSPATQKARISLPFNLVEQLLNYTRINLLPGSPSTSPTASHHIPMLYTSPVLTKYE